jgi:shikimate dehydrogenase
MSQLYAEVIGDPITQSKSPLIHNFWLQTLGIDAHYLATNVKPDGLAAFISERRDDPSWRGCNVTIPHKLAILDHIDAAATSVERVGAANTVYRQSDTLIGHNSDLSGLAAALGTNDQTGRSPAYEAVVVLIGTGGAARAAAAVAAAERASEVRIIARNREAGLSLLDNFNLEGFVFEFAKAHIALDEADCVINATPLGMAGQPPMPASVLRALGDTRAGALIFDMVYDPLATDYLKAAKAFGRTTSDGLQMLVEQARESFQLFFANELKHLAAGQAAMMMREQDEQLRGLLAK